MKPFTLAGYFLSLQNRLTFLRCVAKTQILFMKCTGNSKAQLHKNDQLSLTTYICLWEVQLIKT